MSRKSISLNLHHGVFDRNSPRPPVPGEERTPCVSDWGPAPMELPYLHKPRRKAFNWTADYADPKVLSQRQPYDNSSPPACLRWAVSLHYLLEDSDGVDLFKRFLQSEGTVDPLDFWFACEGLRKQSEPERIHQLIKLIYKRYFLKSSLPISEDIKRDVGKRLKCTESMQSTLFDEAQAQVENLINITTYPNFLNSDLYLHHVQCVQNPMLSSGEYSSESSSSSSSVSNKDLTSMTCGGDPLPIIHENLEFHPTFSHPSGNSMRLTRDMLMVTQKNRALDFRPQTEAFVADMFRGAGLHLAYNSYNPVSRQDSEKQSISSHSDARTESDLSLTDSSIDGRSVYRSLRRKNSLDARMVRESAAINKEVHMYQTLIPRTQRIDKQNCKPIPADEFAAILIQRLEAVKRNQDKYEMLERKLSESEVPTSSEKTRPSSEAQGRELASAIREKLQVDDDNCQQILDEHVSKVFSDNTSHALSPGVTSPRPHSPRKWQGYRMRRRDKDGFSTFSGDSGNVNDFGEETKIVKSKSMPEYPDERFSRACATRRSSSKKALTEFTDSGVSVVSDTPPDHRVITWLMESEQRGSRSSGSHTHSELSGAKCRHKGSTSSTLPSNGSRHRKCYDSRSNSLERNGASTSFGPAQPFVADPSMPPMPQPNTTMQLEEAIRRLKEDSMRTRMKQRIPNKHGGDVPASTQSTLKKCRGAQRQAHSDADEITIAVLSFYDEPYPYRIKIPGKQVTLKQFKEYLPKKGAFRYFFKTECEELDNQVIQEEVVNDADVLPIWEGRINAQLKSMD